MSAQALLPATIGLPILGAGLTLIVSRPAVRRLIAFGVLGAMILSGVAMLMATADGGIVVARAGGWPPLYGIVLAADSFGALMLTAVAIVITTCAVFASFRGEDERRAFLPLVLVLSAGAAGATLTADLFNLFVWFEVMLTASYGLLAWGGSRERVRVGAVYVLTNLLGTTLMLAGIGLAFAAFGTVNMARLGELAAGSPALPIIGVFLFIALIVKSALVPLHGWLPSTYPFASPATAALFSGVLTKLGIFAMYRVYSVVFGLDPRWSWLLLGIAVFSMAGGVLGAVGRGSMRSILSFHMVSQVGYLVLALAIGSEMALAAGIFFLIQYMAVKTSLFLSAGAVETLEGTDRLDRLGGLASRRPWLAATFLLAAFSLSGIPPLSGFVAKFGVVQAAMGERAWLGAIVAVAVSLLTLLSMLKIWNGVFWGAPVSPAVPVPARKRRAALMIMPASFLALFSLVLGFGAPWLYATAQQAARSLVDASAYVQAVLAG